MKASDARRLHELEAENSKLTHLLAEAHLDMRALKSVLGVKKVAPQVKQDAIGKLITKQQMSARHVCRLAGLSRDSYRNAPMWSASRLEH